MKRFLLALLTVLTLFTTAAAESIQSREDLPYDIGNEIGSPAFTGAAFLRPLIQNEDIYNFPAANLVTFEPGARSSWHTHGGMIVLAVAGVGYYQEEGKPAQILRKGDVVNIPEGVNHWHGAVPDSWFSQIVIYDAKYQGDGAEHAMSGPVTDEVYGSLETEEYVGRQERPDERFTFPHAENAVNFPTFNGPVYVSTLVEEDNAAKAPELHYVAFEPGVINNWHTHAGGQILIATDGVGYHQIEGQEVEVLQPGDVAFCPPGVRHWHGGSLADSFAHIAVNTNPEVPGVEWFDRISEETYTEINAQR